MWKVSWLYEKVHNIANFGGYAAILYLLFPGIFCRSYYNNLLFKLQIFISATVYIIKVQ